MACGLLTLPSRAIVRVPARRKSMAADPAAFAMTSDVGAAVEGRVLVRWVSYTSRGYTPWALVGAPIESMLTATGDAWADFLHVGGNGEVFALVAPEGMDRAACAVLTAGSGTVACSVCDGKVWVNGAQAGESISDWGADMSPGESVRLRFVAATRMVSVEWRGRAYDLVALSATSHIAQMRFGVALTPGNSMRVTGASAGALRCHDYTCTCIPYMFLTTVLAMWCAIGFGLTWCVKNLCACATQRTTSCRTCDSSCAPA